MKNKIVFIGMLLFSSFVFSQSNMVKGNVYVSANYGLSQYSIGKYGKVETGFFYKEKLFLGLNVMLEKGFVESTDFENYGLGLFQGFVLFARERVGLNLTINPFIGRESSFSRLNPEGNKVTVYGGSLNLQFDYSISEKFFGRVDFGQWYVRNSQLGSWYYTGTIGFGYVLN